MQYRIAYLLHWRNRKSIAIDRVNNWERNGRALCCVLRETRLLRHVLLAVRRRWSYVVTTRVANVRIITHSGGIWITHACSATHSCEPSRNETCNTHSTRPQSKRDSAVQLIAIPINVDLLHLLMRLFRNCNLEHRYNAWYIFSLFLKCKKQQHTLEIF